MKIVQKYGGSSVATPEKIKNIAKRAVELKKENNDLVIVVSAMGKTTDNLIKLSREITSTPNLREMDRLLSTGEQQTIALLTMAIQELGEKAISLTGEQANIRTIGIHTKSKISNINNEIIEKNLEEGNIVIVAGFQGINEIGEITTLGRGGSDTTAVALAAVLKAKCEIYTDVEGIYTVDPRICNGAKKIDVISYEEMMQLAHLGAKVMETRSIELANKYNVDVSVRLSLSDKEGTLITLKEKIMERKQITGISIDKNLLHITIDNISTYAKNIYPIFDKADKLGITVDMLSQNDVISEKGSFAFTLSKNDEIQIKELVKYINSEMPNVDVLLNENMVKISLVGIGLMSHIGIVTKIFEILKNNNMSFHQIATSEISISLVVSNEIADDLVKLLAKEFELVDNK